MNRKLFQENEREARLFLNQIPYLTPTRFRRLLEVTKTACAIFECPAATLTAAEVSPGLAEQWFRLFRNPEQIKRWELDRDQMERGDVHFVADIDETYPAMLRQIADPPPVLYHKGRWPLPEKAIGLVGTRHPSSYGRSVADRLTTELTVEGYMTVSGLAKGIDTVVHQSTLRAGGHTVAVLGCGFGHVFPAENARLQHQIAEEGTLISEFAISTRPHSLHFPQRNRIISGLSKGVVVIEAGKRSGACITARFGAEQGRDVFAVPGSIFEPASAGCHRLIKEGALLVEKAEDILLELGVAAVQSPPPAEPAPLPEGLSDTEIQVLQLLTTQSRSADELAEVTGSSFGTVANALLVLELKNLIRSLPGQRYARN
jgi:DNA processing protein